MVATPTRAAPGDLRTAIGLIREALLLPIGGARAASDLLTDVARLSGQALAAHRTSLWIYDEARAHLTCRVLLIDGVVRPSALVRLDAAACATYLEAVRRAGALMVDDAQADPRTAELRDYLVARDIGALLDIAVLAPGQMQGIVCHEHVGGPRAWSEAEADFAANVGALVALSLEAERRVLAERAMAGTEARYRHLVESLPVTVYTFDAPTRSFAYLSPHIVKLGGWTAEQWIAAGAHRAWVQAIEPPYRGRALDRLQADIDQGLEEEIEYRVRLPDGTRRWIRDTCAVVRDALGRPLAVQGMLADITAQKDAELARAAVEQSLHDVLHDAELIAVVLDPAGRVRFVNPYFLRLAGGGPEELIGADWFARVAPPGEEARARAAFAEGLAQGHLAPRYESSIMTRTFGERRVLWSNTLLRDADEQVAAVALLGLDITERVERESAEVQRQRLESLGRLAAHVAHDVDNLLVIMHAAMLDLADPTSTRRDEARDEMASALAHTGALVRSLRDYGRREERAPEPIVADQVIAEAWPLAAGLGGDDVSVTFTAGAPEARVAIDATQLRQVLLNLVKNAVDATRAHGGQVLVTTRIVRLEPDEARALHLPTAGELVVMAVSDDGHGMDEATRERAAEPFYTTKAPGQGTGLGLAICAGVAQRAGGHLRLASAPGRGTVVEVYLPTVRAEVPPGAAPRAGRGATVLVVDDQAAIRSLVRRVLERDGFTVIEAGSIARAEVELAAHPETALLIADGRLPDGDGVVFARAAQRRGAIARIVVIAGEPIREPWPGLVTVLAKPFDATQLLAVVARALRD